MRQLNGIYTQKYNKRHHKTGHIYQGRFRAILVQKNSHLLELCRYVVLNPVRAEAIDKPEAWRWSSYQATAGLREEPEFLTIDWLMSMFNSKRAFAQKQYRTFVWDGIHRGSPWDRLHGQILLGDEGFVEKFKELIEDRKEVREIPRPQRYVTRPSLDKIFSGQETKVQRNIGIHVAHMSYGYTLKEIADYLRIHYTTVSKVIAKAGVLKK
jgi:hypothetical protein